MNTLQRPLFDAPMPMVEGSGITSMAMEESAGEKLGADLTATIAQGVAETESAIDAADDNVGIMNALRGKQASEEEYRTELASYVGRKDANATPESVLALVQPTIAMMELGEAPMGGIGDMMPPQTFGVEEEVFGKLPVQKLQAGGLAGRVAGIQALQKQFLPSEEQIQQAFAVQQPTTAQNLLAVGAPFVQGLLAPSQQGGGLNAALSLASQAASQQIAAQRETEQASKQRIAQALLNQQMQSGQSALTAGLAQEQKELDRQNELAKAIATRTTKPDRTSEFERLQEKYFAMEDKTTPLAQSIKRRLDTFETDSDGRPAAARIAALSDYANTKLKKYENFQENVLGNIRVLSSLDQAIEFSKEGDIGPGTTLRRNALDRFESVGRLIPGAEPITRKLRQAIAGNLDEDAARKAFESGFTALQAQQTLNFVDNFPGNLNESEVQLSRDAAAGKDLKPEQLKKVRETIKRRMQLEKDFADAYARAEDAFNELDESKQSPYRLYKMIQDEVRGVINIKANAFLNDEDDPVVPEIDGDQGESETQISQLFGTGLGQRSKAVGTIQESAEALAEAYKNEFAANPNKYQSDVQAQQLALTTAIEVLEPSNARYVDFPKETKRKYLQQLIAALETEGTSDFSQSFTVRDKQIGMFSVNTALRAAKLLLEDL